MMVFSEAISNNHYCTKFGLIYVWLLLNICRHLGVALELLVKLVRTFGPMIHSTVSAGPCVGVDLEAEQRYCFR